MADYISYLPAELLIEICKYLDEINIYNLQAVLPLSQAILIRDKCLQNFDAGIYICLTDNITAESGRNLEDFLERRCARILKTREKIPIVNIYYHDEFLNLKIFTRPIVQYICLMQKKFIPDEDDLRNDIEIFSYLVANNYAHFLRKKKFIKQRLSILYVYVYVVDLFKEVTNLQSLLSILKFIHKVKKFMKPVDDIGLFDSLIMHNLKNYHENLDFQIWKNLDKSPHELIWHYFPELIVQWQTLCKNPNNTSTLIENLIDKHNNVKIREILRKAVYNFSYKTSSLLLWNLLIFIIADEQRSLINFGQIQISPYTQEEPDQLYNLFNFPQNILQCLIDLLYH